MNLQDFLVFTKNLKFSISEFYLKTCKMFIYFLCYFDRLFDLFSFQFRIMLAEDASGKGAALTAAIALKLENQSN